MSATQLQGPPAGQFREEMRGQDQVRQNGGPAFEAKVFYTMLDDPKFCSELRKMLPDNIDVATFVRTAKTAVATNVDLLKPEYRASLMQSIVKAAGQGLLPDGKHGALIPRWDDKAGRTQVCWQPMVWGITQLGRRAGALKKITAHIVFEGEEYELLGGEEDKITHRINPNIVEEAYAKGRSPEAFFERVALAYCIITAPDGTQIWRYMTRSRIARVKASSKAGKGPWSGQFMDEMILKTVILFTAKHIDLDGDTPEMRRFREAMETDLEADFDEVGAQSISAPPSRPALSAPSGSAMDRLEAQLLGAAATKQKETVTVSGGGSQDQKDQRADQSSREPETGKSEKEVASGQGSEGQSQQDTGGDAASGSEEWDDAGASAKAAAEAAGKAAEAADKASQKFADDFVALIATAAAAFEPGDALASAVGAKGSKNSLKRLKERFPARYWVVVRSFLRPEVIGHIGMISDTNRTLFDDITAKIAEAEDAAAKGEAS